MADRTPREIDILLGRLLFGYGREVGVVPPDARGEHGGTEILLPPTGLPHGWTYPNLGAISRDFFIPHYTTDRLRDWTEIAVAMKQRKHFWLTLTNNRDDVRWVAVFQHEAEADQYGAAVGDDPKYTVCLAAVRALGGDSVVASK